MCAHCFALLRQEKDVPMALSNDNMWGYIDSIVTRYRVRWIRNGRCGALLDVHDRLLR